MLTLSLFRHAKSSWSQAGTTDFQRPLAARGELAAPAMGAHMARNGLIPDRILCSTAARTRQTLELILAEWQERPEIIFEDRLYLSDPRRIFEFIRATREPVRHLMVIGHNPDLQSLALDLAGAGETTDMQALATKFPTAGLAVIRFDVETWGKVQPGTGKLAHYMTPKRLAQSA